MAETGVSTDLGTMLSRHLQAIAGVMARAGGPIPESAGAEPQPAGDEVFLSMEGALDLGNGSRMVLPSAAGPVRWTVLQSLLADDEPGGFEWKGTLPETLDAATFVAGAYRLLLDRDADAQGLAAYVPMLAAPDGCQRVLRMIASSEEASARSRALILAPESMLAEAR